MTQYLQGEICRSAAVVLSAKRMQRCVSCMAGKTLTRRRGLGGPRQGCYVIVRKLGWGLSRWHGLRMITSEYVVSMLSLSLSSSHQLRRMNSHAALEDIETAPQYTDTAPDKIKCLQRLVIYATPSSFYPASPGHSHAISFLDHFRKFRPHPCALDVRAGKAGCIWTRSYADSSGCAPC